MSEPLIIGTGEAPYTRFPEVGKTTELFILDAARRALDDAGLGFDDVDGLALASFTAGPDTAIDIAWKLGMRLRWLSQDATGGASGMNMLRLARRAIEAGDAHTILIIAGDRIFNREFIRIADGYNRVTRDHLAVLPFDGPNTLFSFVTQRHAAKHGLGREAYASVAIGQRSWAVHNPGAVYRTPLTLEEYLSAPLVAPPLGRFDCPKVVSGADAVVLSARRPNARPACRIRALDASFNHDHQEGDGLVTGLAEIRNGLWDHAGLGPGDVDVAALYDDYPVMVLIQAADLGLVEDGDIGRFARAITAGYPLNTSGGQLSAGQAGAAGGMHGLVEVARQLRGACRERQIADARLGLVTGSGMGLHRSGAGSIAGVLERVP